MCTLDTHISLNPKLADTGKQLLILLYQGHQEFPLEYVIKKKPNCMVSHSFSTIFSYWWAGRMSVQPMFWTNEKLSLMVEWSSSVSISFFKVQSSVGHLVCFCDSGNSWCLYREIFEGKLHNKTLTDMETQCSVCFRKAGICWFKHCSKGIFRCVIVRSVESNKNVQCTYRTVTGGANIANTRVTTDR